MEGAFRGVHVRLGDLSRLVQCLLGIHGEDGRAGLPVNRVGNPHVGGQHSIIQHVARGELLAPLRYTLGIRHDVLVVGTETDGIPESA